MQDKRKRIVLIVIVLILAVVAVNGFMRIRRNYYSSHMTKRELRYAIENHQSILVYSIDDMPDTYTSLRIIPKSYAKATKANLKILPVDSMICILVVDENEIENVLTCVSQREEIEYIFIHNINVHDFNALSHMEHLEVLHYDNFENRESDANELSFSFDGTFPALKELRIYFTKLPSLGDIGKITGLKKVDFSYTDLSDITALGTLTNMEELYLMNTNVHDITALRDMTNMRELYLDYAFVSDISALSDMAQLEVLSVWQPDYDNHTEDELIQDITPLSGKNSLRELILYGSGVRDVSPLKNLPALEYLDLRHTQIEDLDFLDYLPALKTVSFANCDNLKVDERSAYFDWLEKSGNNVGY